MNIWTRRNQASTSISYQANRCLLLPIIHSGSGWPSFTKPIEPVNIRELPDPTHGVTGIEVRSAQGDSHLGHVFDDGPTDRGGLRYCINSASLRFIHRDDMVAEGYADYVIRWRILMTETAMINGYRAHIQQHAARRARTWAERHTQRRSEAL